MRSWPKMAMKAMSESMAKLWQFLWLVLPLENTGMPLVWAAAGDHLDIQGLYTTGPISHPWQHLGESRPCTRPRQHSGACPDCRSRMSWSPESECRRADLAIGWHGL